MSRELIIIGAGSVGGHIVSNLNMYFSNRIHPIFLDDDAGKHHKKLCGIGILGGISEIKKFDLDTPIIIGIYSPDERFIASEYLKKMGYFNFPTLISKKTWISNKVNIGEGSILYPGCNIDYNTDVGKFVIMGMNSVVGHDCIINDFSSIYPNVNIEDKINVDERSEIVCYSSFSKSATTQGDSTLLYKKKNNDMVKKSNNKQTMNILINGVGGPTPRSIARTLRKYSNYDNLKLFGTDINRLAYGLYEQELYDKTFLVPSANEKNYWDEMERIIKENHINLALVHPEHEVMAWSKRQSSNKGLPCKAYLPDYKLCEALVDKSKMTELLKNTELVPNSFVFDANIQNFKLLESTLKYPFWVRATEGSSGLGSLMVKNRAELKNWLNINPEVKVFIGSTYLPGRNLGVKMLYHKGKLLRAASAERVNYIMAKVAPSGITGNTSYGRLLNEPRLVEKADEALQILFESLGVEKHGFFTADFKEDERGVPYITEINVRMVAFNLSFAAGGANFTKDIVDLLINESSVDQTYKMYEFEPETIFLRDVDALPKLMKESDLF